MNFYIIITLLDWYGGNRVTQEILRKSTKNTINYWFLHIFPAYQILRT